MSGLITFSSDYGHAGGYVAACEAVIATLDPSARVLHITHEIAVGDVGEGAQVLARVAPLGPIAVHLAVVDPGVGTSRRPLVVHADRGDYLVGPDNGLLLPAAAALGGVVTAWSLDPHRLRTQAGLPAHFPATFHGRDLFAPATALLDRGLLPPLLAEPVDAATLTSLPPDVLLDPSPRRRAFAGLSPRSSSLSPLSPRAARSSSRVSSPGSMPGSSKGVRRLR